MDQEDYDATLPSRFQLDDEVSFIPEGETDYEDGTIVGVHFSVSKVTYDVLDEDDEVIEGVDSSDVEPRDGEPVQPDEVPE